MRNNLFIIVALFVVSTSFSQKNQKLSLNNSIDSVYKSNNILFKNAGIDLKNLSFDKTENKYMAFLYAFMPLSDITNYSKDFFLKNVKQSIIAKNDFEWGKAIPEDIFLHFVLPIRVNNENLDTFRTEVYKELKSRIVGLSMREAALEVNHWCHEKVTYQASDERTSSPLATMNYSFGRCGEESTFTVAALRTVGIPARQVYTPRWAHSDDNHAWVEVWVDGKWYFMGACEPEPELNMGWFAAPAARAMLVHTRAFGYYTGNEPVITSELKFSELNLINNYAPAKNLFVKVIDSNNDAIENAFVEFQLYNYAEFYPIARKKTDKNGLTKIEIGLGDLIIWAYKENFFGFKKTSVTGADTIIVKIENEKIINEKYSFDLTPPVEREIVKVSDKGIKENQIKLNIEDSIRKAYMNRTFKDSLWAKIYSEKYNINNDSATHIIINSFNNSQNITDFISNTKHELRPKALKFLYTLKAKDLRDTKSDILKEHFIESINYYSDFNNDLFYNYIACPRISYEMISNWRKELRIFFEKVLGKKPNQQEIFDWISKNIIIDNSLNAHSRLPQNPEKLIKIRISDDKSRNILFVAACRSLGIPARINQETYTTQYWANNEWINVNFYENFNNSAEEIGYISLKTSMEKELEPKYYSNFTISKLNKGVYRTINFEEFLPVSKFPEKIELSTGNYLLVTGNRLNDGTVLSEMEFFEVIKAQTTSLNVNIRESNIEKPILGTINQDSLNLYDYNNKNLTALGEQFVLIFIDPDKEPSKHVLKDIGMVKQNFEKWNGEIYIVLNESNLSSSFSPLEIKNLPAKSNFLTCKNKEQLKLLKATNKQSDNQLPMIFLIDNKNILFYSSGYRIGIGETLVKEINQIK